MPIAWLGYKDPDVSSGALQAVRLRVLTDYELPVTSHVSDRTLTGKLRSLVIARWSTYRVAVGVDALLTPLNKLFMRAFWNAPHKFIAFDDNPAQPDEGTFTEIYCGSGEAPIEFVGGLKEFESWSLVCEEVDGSI